MVVGFTCYRHDGPIRVSNTAKKMEIMQFKASRVECPLSKLMAMSPKLFYGQNFLWLLLTPSTLRGPWFVRLSFHFDILQLNNGVSSVSMEEMGKLFSDVSDFFAVFFSSICQLITPFMFASSFIMNFPFSPFWLVTLRKDRQRPTENTISRETMLLSVRSQNE